MIDERPDAAELEAAVLGVTGPIVARARSLIGGPLLPDLKSRSWLDAAPEVKLAGIVICGVAWLVEDPRQAERRALREAAYDVHGGDVQMWADLAAREPRTAILARRAEPVTPVRCTGPRCRVVVSVPHPLPPDFSTAVRCTRCRAQGEVAA